MHYNRVPVLLLRIQLHKGGRYVLRALALHAAAAECRSLDTNMCYAMLCYAMLSWHTLCRRHPTSQPLYGHCGCRLVSVYFRAFVPRLGQMGCMTRRHSLLGLPHAHTSVVLVLADPIICTVVAVGSHFFSLGCPPPHDGAA